MSARNRRKMITCGALYSRKLARVSSDAERVYWRVYMASDNYGVMLGEAWDVKAEAAAMVGSLSEVKVAKAVDDLVEAGLLQRFQHGGDTWLHVLGHDDKQSPDFLRKRGKRRTPKPPEIPHGEREAALLCPNSALRAEFSAPITSTTTTTPKGIEGSNEPMSDNGPAVSNFDDIKIVFEHWVAKTWNGKGRRPSLSPQRKAVIRARRSEGFTPDDLCQAIDGYAADSFYAGDNEAGKPYLELARRLSNAANVEQGIQLAVSPRTPKARGSAAPATRQSATPLEAYDATSR